MKNSMFLRSYDPMCFYMSDLASCTRKLPQQAPSLSPNTSITQYEQSVYQNMIYGKKLSNTDVSFMVNRYQWTSNTIYSRYDNNDSDLYSKHFFVINDTNDVYKCIHNGYSAQNPEGIPSLVKPSVKNTSGNFQTSDGYIWKYMFTCEPNAYINFNTSNYIPEIGRAHV